MNPIERQREPHPAPSDAAETAIWSRALSLTGALLAHMASNPQTQRLVSEMLSAGVVPHQPIGAPAAPFDEPLTGLQTRELTGPDVFREFFGVRAAAAPRCCRPESPRPVRTSARLPGRKKGADTSGAPGAVVARWARAGVERQEWG